MLELINIHKSYREFRVENIRLQVYPGDYFVILGRSGAGKTLLLEMAAGIRQPDQGTILLGGQDITSTRPQDRNIGLVFQDQAIFPHMTVAGNIAYPLRRGGYKRKDIRVRVRDLARTAGLTDLLDRYPATLSGGESQRTVLARTLASEPQVLLLDEPLSSLDVQYKRELQSFLRTLNQQGQTIVHVTHDYEEAMALANRVAVIDRGRIRQQGEIHEVFRNPSNSFIAEFVGIRNFFRGHVEAWPGRQPKRARVDNGVAFAVPAATDEGEVVITLEARNIILSKNKTESSALNNFYGTVRDVVPTRQGLEVVVDIGIDLAALITRESLVKLNIQTGSKVWISFKASSLGVSRV
jgi:molybdopterin-binding protein